MDRTITLIIKDLHEYGVDINKNNIVYITKCLVQAYLQGQLDALKEVNKKNE